MTNNNNNLLKKLMKINKKCINVGVADDNQIYKIMLRSGRHGNSNRKEKRRKNENTFST